MTTVKRDHLAEGKQAVEKFVHMLECLTTLSADCCTAAAEAGSSDRKVIGSQVDALLTGITAVATVGSMVIAALVSARIQLDAANAQLATINGLDVAEAAPVSDEVKNMVKEALESAANRKE